MRNIQYLIALSGLLGSMVLLPLGCSHYYEDYYVSLTDPKLASGGTGSGSGSSSASSGTGGTPIHCIPSESADPVAESCGVFVSSSLGVDDTAPCGGDQRAL